MTSFSSQWILSHSTWYKIRRSRHRLKGINTWIAFKFGTSTRRVLQIEISVLVAVGFSLMQIGEWILAIACWVLLGFVGSAKVLTWEGLRGNKVLSAFLKFCYALAALALCVLLIMITVLRKPENEPWSNLLKLRHKPIEISTAKSVQPESLLTLEALFKTDFPNLFKTTMVSDPVVFEDGERVTLTSQEYEDFTTKSSFVGFYIPLTFKTFRVCVRVGNSVPHFIDEINKRMSLQMYDTSGTSLRDLTFSGRVFVYHEEPLTLKQKAVLVDYFRSKKLAVEFRGIEYLQAVVMERKLKTLQSK
jgi:hypothetical protein